MKKSYIFCALMPLALLACNQENDLKLQEGTTATELEQEVDYFSNPNNSLAPGTSNEISIQPTAAPTTLNTQPAPSNSNVKLNPEHGQPGHRCDIPVGAPLNSAPQQQPAPAPTPSVQLTPPAQSTPAAVTPVQSAPPSLSQSGNVKLNPEHGQPGHRCEIPVGQPLPD